MKNGQQTLGKVLDEAVFMLQLRDGRILALKLLDGQVLNNQVRGYFKAQTFSTGYFVSGEIDPQSQQLTRVSLRSGALKIPDPRTLITYHALNYHFPVSKPDGKVLGISNSPFPESNIILEIPGLNWPVLVFNSELETWSFKNLIDETQLPRLVTTSDVINYFDQQISKLQTVSVSQTELTSLTSFLTVTPSGNNYQLSLNLQNTINSASVINGSLTSDDLGGGSVNSSQIADHTITDSDIKGDTISTDQLTSDLTFSAGDLLDLSAINHSDTTSQGLLLPNVSSASPSLPTSGEGYLAYDTSGDQVVYYDGSSWNQIGGTTTLYTGVLDSSVASSVSGLELIDTNQLSLIRGCSDTQVLKWDEAGKLWQCANDSGVGSGISAIEENNSSVVTSAVTIDFSGTDFDVINAGGGEGDIAIDYTNSGITRNSRNESISGAWTFSSDISLNNAGAEVKILESGGTPTLYGILDVDDLSGSDATYLFSGASGTVLTSANAATALSGWDQNSSDDLTTSNYTGTLDSVYVNVGESPTAGDISGSFTAGLTIGGDSVALGTDTTNNYVATGASGNGVSLSGGGSEGATLTAALGVLTANWNQTGAFDISLNNAGSEIQILESAGDTFFGILDVGDLSGSSSTYLFSGASGTVLTSANAATALSGWDQNSSDDLTTSNYTGTLDSVYVNVGESPTAGDISGSFTAGLTIAGDSVALGTDTTNNYIAGATVNGGLTMSGTEGGTLGLLTSCSPNEILKWNGSVWGCSADADTGGTNYWQLVNSDTGLAPVNAAVSDIFAGGTATGSARFQVEGLTGNVTAAGTLTLTAAAAQIKLLESGGTPSLYGILDVDDLSGSDATYLFSGASGTVLTSANAATALSGWDQNSSDDLTTGNYTTTLDSVYVNTGESPTAGDISGSFTAGLTIAGDSVALGTDTTNNYIAGATVNGGLTMSGTEGGTLGLLTSCSPNEILKWNGSVWGCSADADTGGTNYWQLVNSDTGLAPVNAAVSDIFAGGTATGSARFQVEGLTGNVTAAGTLTLTAAAAQIKLLESGGTPSLYGILDVDDLSGSDATYLFSGASGTVLTSANAATALSGWDQNSSDDLTTGNYTRTLDSVYVNVGESPTAGDISGSFTAGLTIAGDSVALGTDTTNNYIAGATVNGGLTMSGTEGGTLGLLTSCSPNEILKWNGSVWGCSADADTGGTNYWQLVNSDTGLAPVNAAVSDLFAGGTATGSARFQVEGLTGNVTAAGTLTLTAAAAQIKLLESGGTPSLYGILDVDDLSGSDATYLFSGASGTVLTSANAATALSGWDQNSC